MCIMGVIWMNCLEKLRKSEKLTQAEMAQTLGVSASFYSKIELVMVLLACLSWLKMQKRMVSRSYLSAQIMLQLVT